MRKIQMIHKKMINKIQIITKNIKMTWKNLHNIYKQFGQDKKT